LAHAAPNPAVTRGDQVLLVNPWIYDFAAYNLWIEPLGLLVIAAVLRESGYGVTVIDCLAPYPGGPPARQDGSGKFSKTIVPKPDAIAFVPRRFGRYGLPVPYFDAELADVGRPDAILVASGMTYWYPGVIEVIQRLRVRFEGVPVALGGVYATLCYEHAQETSGADRVIGGPGVVEALQFVAEATGQELETARYADPQVWPLAAHDLVPRPFAGILTSWGCPYRCTYCASHLLQPTFVRRRPAVVLEEISLCAQSGIRDLAFYDDALLLDAESHIVPILEGIVRRGLQVRLHTPNGLHAQAITPDLAQLMREAGFATLRLSLETVDTERQRATGGKVTTGDLARAVAHLQAAGFGPDRLGAYILAGLPDQPTEEVESAVRFVHELGVQAKLALYSPIPGTPDGDDALRPSADPLLHNNTVYPYLLGPEYVRDLQKIKLLAKEGNLALVGRV
jgi:radical SAM superfamily enzyme YgiQ (UPF0313 family)